MAEEKTDKTEQQLDIQPVVNAVLEQMKENENLPELNSTQTEWFLSRARFLTQTLMGGTTNVLDTQNRNLDYECGFPDTISLPMYQEMYDRQGVSTRVVDLFPEECWETYPIVTDNPKADDTEFEKTWNAMEEEISVFSELQRVDILSGIGQYGVLLIGWDDGEELSEPAYGGTSGAKTTNKILYLRAFSQSNVKITKTETDVTNERFGRPTEYQITFGEEKSLNSGTSISIQKEVHWTRIIHVADNRKDSVNFGVPRMQTVFNYLLSVRKLLGSSPEMYWKGAFPGLVASMDPTVGKLPSITDQEATKQHMEAYMNGLQRYLAVIGGDVKSLAPQHVDPGKDLDAQYQAIAITLGVPLRLLIGSEAGHLASTQDDTRWNRRVMKRQEAYVTPSIIRPFVDRCIEYGALPDPEKGSYDVEWKNLQELSEKDKEEVKKIKTQTLGEYVQKDVSRLVGPEAFLKQIMEMSEEEIEEVQTEILGIENDMSDETDETGDNGVED